MKNSNLISHDLLSYLTNRYRFIQKAIQSTNTKDAFQAKLIDEIRSS